MQMNEIFSGKNVNGKKIFVVQYDWTDMKRASIKSSSCYKRFNWK